MFVMYYVVHCILCYALCDLYSYITSARIITVTPIDKSSPGGDLSMGIPGGERGGGGSLC